MSKPHIVQCLCGPARHCIMAFAYEPRADMTEANAVDRLRLFVDTAIERRMFDLWCSICHARRDEWVFEDAPLAFDSLEEARPYLEQAEKQQMLTRRIFEEGRN
jgi:hypothetical protein